MNICTIDGCTKRVKGHGMCQMHYRRWYIHGDARHVMVEHVMGSLLDKFEAKYIPVPESGCWLWTGATTGGRVVEHGVLGAGGKKKQLAHRVAWEIHIGPIPEGMNVLHSCDVGVCVNPYHLFLGTQAQNIADMIAKGRDRQSSGSDNGLSKLTEDDVIAIRTRAAAGESKVSLSSEYGVNPSNISHIVLRRNWKHL